MKLIDEWKSAWRYFSVQANAIGAAISLTYVSMYEQLRDSFPPKIIAVITASVFLIGIIGRLTSQKKKK